MEYKFECWNDYQSLNNDHLTVYKEIGLNSAKTFINVRELPQNPKLMSWSSSSEWQSYMNHLDVYLPRMFTCWNNNSKDFWVGNPKGFTPSVTKDGEKFSDFQNACKQAGLIPIYCIGSSEEAIPIGDWLGRAPTSDKWRWLGRFCKEFAIFINKKYGFKKAVLEIWNEPIKTFGNYDATWYMHLGAYMAKGWKSANLGSGYEVWINSNDIQHQGFIDQLLRFENLMMYTTAITTHCNSRAEWDYREKGTGATYFQIVNRKIHQSPLCIKYKVVKQILSEMSPVSGLNDYSNPSSQVSQLKTFKARFELIKNKVSGYGMLFVWVNDIIHTGDMDEIVIFQLYDKNGKLSGNILGKNAGKYDYLKSYNLS